jgi:UDP-N-acetylglucosamine--N-acetylmuramyl-(pentapeptide) pyrophosphoryl-undecaprenol N-acetylglucosamine transferase
MKVVIAGGGTAGHVNPALALARSLPGEDITFLGTSRGAEALLVPEYGYELEEIEVRGFDRSRPLSVFGTGVKAASAFVTARRMLRALAPDIVVGMGGYVSLPACFGARALKVPVVIHEQNAVFGLANRLSKRWARAVAVSFEETLEAAGPRGVFTGNPVLPALLELDLQAARKAAIARWDLDAARKTLLVFGGSQGAKSINEGAVGLADRWRDREDVQVLHVTGSAAFADIERRTIETARERRLLYRVVDYVSQMGDAYSLADVALCRGGATTVAELGVVGLPAIIVPYPHHRDQQQMRHGRALERAGAATVVPDAEATTQRIAAEAERILLDPDRLTAMRSAARALGRPDAAARLAAVVKGEVA